MICLEKWSNKTVVMMRRQDSIDCFRWKDMLYLRQKTNRQIQVCGLEKQNEKIFSAAYDAGNI